MTLERRLHSVHARLGVQQDELVAFGAEQTATFVEPLAAKDLVDARFAQVEFAFDEKTRQALSEVRRREEIALGGRDQR